MVLDDVSFCGTNNGTGCSFLTKLIEHGIMISKLWDMVSHTG